MCIGGLIGFSLAIDYCNFLDKLDKIQIIQKPDNYEKQNLYNELNKCKIENQDFIVLSYQTVDSFQEKGFYCTVNRCLADGYCKEERLKLDIK